MNSHTTPDGSAWIVEERFGEIPTLRDQFAMAALTGFLAGPSSSQDACEARANPDKAAAWSYEHADAMLKAREAK